MKIEQDRIILVLPVDADPLLRPVDIDVHRLVNTTLGSALVYTLTDPSGEKKEHDGRDYNDSRPFKYL